MTRNQMRRRFIGISFDALCAAVIIFGALALYSVFGELR